MAKELNVLPSLVIMSDGNKKEISTFSNKEHEKWSEKMCKQIGSAVSDYYADDTEGWNKFVGDMAL